MRFATVPLSSLLPLLLRFYAIAAAAAAEDGRPEISKCWVECNFNYTGFEVVPETGCSYYYECWKGAGVLKQCGPPLVFNKEMDYCDFPSNVECPDMHVECPDDLTAPPTRTPTRTPTSPPTRQPTSAPMKSIIINKDPTHDKTESTLTPTLSPTENTNAPTDNPTMIPTGAAEGMEAELVLILQGEFPVDAAIAMGLSEQDVLSEAVLDLLAAMLAEMSISVDGVDVTGQSFNFRRGRRRSRSLASSSLDVSMNIKGEYRPPPHHDLNVLARDSINAESRALVRDFKERGRRAGTGFFEAVTGADAFQAGAPRPTRRPTPAPTAPPTVRPTDRPTRRPTSQPTPAPTPFPASVIAHIESKRALVEELVLVSYNSVSGQTQPSKSYTYSKFIQSLQIMGVEGFGADFKFLLWEGDSSRSSGFPKYVYGLVNVAAFLANAQVEAIESDTCDELNWQMVDGKYPISNSCGQEGRSYQDENCERGSTEFMSCDVDTDMSVTAVSSGTQYRAPPPLQCRPRRIEDKTGYWDTASGREVDSPFSNSAGRTDIAGCCWWGRGALSTRGVCQIGKINYFLGKRGADLGRSTLYPTIDFCKFPEVTCTSASRSLQWTTALFEWSERVQRYDSDGWSFEDQLIKFVNDGMDSSDSDSFFDSVCRILSRGCHASGCSEDEVRMMSKRRENFFMIINDVLDLKSLLADPKVVPNRNQQHSTTTVPPTVAPTEPRKVTQADLPAVLPAVSPSQQMPNLLSTPTPTGSPVAQQEQNVFNRDDVSRVTNRDIAKQWFLLKVFTVASILYSYLTV